LPASSSYLPTVFARTATHSLIDEHPGRKMTLDPVTSHGNLRDRRPDPNTDPPAETLAASYPSATSNRTGVSAVTFVASNKIGTQ
jgi:hypothetical protein